MQLQAAVTGLAVGGMLVLFVGYCDGPGGRAAVVERGGQKAGDDGASGNGWKRATVGPPRAAKAGQGGRVANPPPLGTDALLPDEDFDWRAWEMQPWEIEEV